MPLIDSNNNASNETSRQYWQNELVNSRVLLFELNKAINAITKTNIQSYSLETGQSRQSVTRADLPQLIQQRDNLMEQIRKLEAYLGEGQPSVIQVRPDW